MKTLAALLALLVTACTATAPKKEPASSDVKLRDEIAAADRALFNAFNAHDGDALATYFDKSLEFYHDKDGKLSYEQTVSGLRNSMKNNSGIRRELVPGTLAVYPVPNYGAIETGLHRFCHEENGKTDCGTFQFLMIWQKQADGWKVTRVVSYDH